MVILLFEISHSNSTSSLNVLLFYHFIGFIFVHVYTVNKMFSQLTVLVLYCKSIP